MSELDELLSRLGIGSELTAAGGDGQSTWVYTQWAKEVALASGWLVLTALVSPIVLPAVWIGELVAGGEGYRVGGDIAFGIIAFGASGMLFHLVRLLALRAYWIASVRTWRPPDPDVPAPEPPWTVRRMLTPTRLDTAFQTLCAIATATILIRFQP